MARRSRSLSRGLAVALLVLLSGTLGAGRAAAQAPGAGLTVKPGLCDAKRYSPNVRSKLYGHTLLGCRATGTGAQDLVRRAGEQKWTTMMDDELADLAYKAVIKRVNRAWDAGKATLPAGDGSGLDPQTQMRRQQNETYQELLALNRQVVAGSIRKEFKATAADKEEFANVNTRYAMLQADQMWDHELAAGYYTRLDAAMKADKAGLKDYQAEYDDATGANASAATKATCTARTALTSLVKHGTSRRVKSALCRANLTKNAKKAVGGAVKSVAGWIGKQLWDGIFGPLIKALNEGTTWLSTELAKQMDKLVEVNFNRAWLGTLISRSAGVAIIVGTIASLIGLLGATMRGSGREAGEVLGRAMTIGIVTGMVLAVMQIASGLGAAFAQVMAGPTSGSRGAISTLATSFTKAMVDAKVPEVPALVFVLLLLFGLFLLTLELAFRGPLLMMLALLYPPVYASSTLRLGRETLNNLNGLIIGLLLLPFVAVLGLEVASNLAQGADDWPNLLVAVCALLAASALPLLMMVLISPAAGFIAGMSGRTAMGQAAKAGRAGASVGGSAASGAKRAAKVGEAAASKAADGGGRMASSAWAASGGSKKVAGAVAAVKNRRRGGGGGGAAPTGDNDEPWLPPGGTGGAPGGGPAGTRPGRGGGRTAPGTGGAPRSGPSTPTTPGTAARGGGPQGGSGPTGGRRAPGDGSPPGAAGASGPSRGPATTGGPAPRTSNGGSRAPRQGRPSPPKSGGGAPKNSGRPPAGPKNRGGRKPPGTTS